MSVNATQLVRIATIGAGSLSTKRIYPCLERLGVSLEAVCDLVEAKAADAARRFGGRRVYTDPQRMLDECELDAVIICIGPAQHAEMAIALLRRGLHVYTEKPPAATAAAALELARTQEETGCLAMCAFKKRYAPVYVKMKEQLSDVEAFPPPWTLSIRRSSGWCPKYDAENPRTWFLLDYGIHTIDLIRFLMGEPETVYAVGDPKTHHVIAFVFPGGSVGSLTIAWRARGNQPDEQVAVYATGGSWVEARDHTELRRCDGPVTNILHRLDFSMAGGDGLVEGGFFGELEAFLHAVRTGDRSKVVSDAANSYRTMALYEAIEESLKRGEMVRVRRDM